MLDENHDALWLVLSISASTGTGNTIIFQWQNMCLVSTSHGLLWASLPFADDLCLGFSQGILGRSPTVRWYPLRNCPNSMGDHLRGSTPLHQFIFHPHLFTPCYRRAPDGSQDEEARKRQAVGPRKWQLESAAQQGSHLQRFYAAEKARFFLKNTMT